MCQSRDIGLDSLYCGKWRTISKSRHDLDLDRTMPNIELVRAIFIYYNVLNTHTRTRARAHTHTHTSIFGADVYHVPGLYLLGIGGDLL